MKRVENLSRGTRLRAPGELGSVIALLVILLLIILAIIQSLGD